MIRPLNGTVARTGGHLPSGATDSTTDQQRTADRNCDQPVSVASESFAGAIRSSMNVFHS